MENIVKMSMDGYMESLAGDIEQIKAHPEKGCCDAVEVEVLENVLGIMNSHFSDYDTLCSENKAMAEFLASLGYSQEQVTDIANGGKPKPLTNEDKLKESCRLATIGFFHADYPDDKSTDKLWEMAKKGKLQVCEAYENFGTASLVEEMQSLERLMLSEISQALSQIGGVQ